jgi:hypothetical protein
MRCKHCGLVLQAKQPPAAVRAAVPSAPANRTPPPATRPTSARVQTAAPNPAAQRVKPAVPVAVPVAAPVGGSPFADLRTGDENEARPARRRRKGGGGWWKGAVIAAALLVTAGFVAAFNWPRIVALLPPLPDEPAVAVNDSPDNVTDPATTEPPPKKVEPKKTPATVKARPDKGKPKGDPVVKKNPPPKNPPNNVPPKGEPPATANQLFPRRALVISVHDYLYANPVHDGIHGPNSVHLSVFLDKLSGSQQQEGRGFKIPMPQIAQLSDGAMPKWKPRAPTRPVIEKTLTNFLDSSRAQDRIMVFFIGHSVELGEEVYLAPIEGELDKADTLIPLKWVYEQLQKCKARQKVLVLDVNRYSPSSGQERPGSGEMGPRLDAMLQKPPAGVQVLSSCIGKQRSYELDVRIGAFFYAWHEVMKDRQWASHIQKIDDPLPLERCVQMINERLKKELAPFKLEQVCRLTGKEAEGGASYNKNEPPPPVAMNSLAAPPPGAPESKALVKAVLEQVGTPPVKPAMEAGDLHYDALPPFPEEALKKYEGDKPNPDSKLRQAVHKARAALWAIYPAEAPRGMAGEVQKFRQVARGDLSVVRDGYTAPNGGGNAENQFKGRVENDERNVARLMRVMQDALEELQAKEVTAERGKESKRWQANYDFMLARIQMEYAFLYEYQSMLGQMRKEFPPRDPNLHKGWKLAAQPNLTGDSKGKGFASKARTLLEKIAKEHKDTPWEVLAKRERLTNLGLEWQASP